MTGGLFHPIKVISADISCDVPDVSMADQGNGAYGGVFCLVRSGARPLRVVEFPFRGETLSGEELLARIGSDETPDTEPAVRGPVKEKPVSVVVATRDRADSLARCLDSLLDQTRQPREVVVVDNAPSSSQTADLVAARYHATGRVRYLREDVPGLGRAHNTGLRLVSSEIVLFTDDDVIADRHWVEAIARNFDDAGSVGCVTGLILPAELETRAQVWTERHGGFGKGFARKVYDLVEYRPPGPLFPYTAGQFGSGANMAFSKTALRYIGGFDPALGAGTLARGGDDLAAFYAVLNDGFQLVYEPGAIIWHHHRRSEEGMRRQAFGYGMGLGAYLTKVVRDEPRSILRLLRALPAGFAHMVGPSAQKNMRLPADYPTALIWLERLGILAGTVGYFRSRGRHASLMTARAVSREELAG